MLTAENARRIWIEENLAISRLAGDEPPEIERLERQWSELAHGRRAKYLTDLAHGATTGRRIMEMQCGLEDTSEDQT